MLLNGGQVCIRGDYVLVPEAHFTPFVALVKDGAFLLRTWYLCIPTLFVKQVVHRVTLPLYGYTVHERK